MVDAHLGTIGVWLAFVASIVGAIVLLFGLVAAPRQRRDPDRHIGASRRG